MKPIITSIRTDPVYKEVEEFGRTKLVLMRKVGYIIHMPESKVLVEIEPEDGIDLAWDYKIIPEYTKAYWEWEKV